MLKLSLVILFGLLSAPASFADWDTKFVSSKDQSLHSLADVLATIHPGQVIVMGETHDYLPDHTNQILFLRELALRSQAPISVGMEFFEYPEQAMVDSYLEGKIDDADFLKNVGWGGDDFSQYRAQVLFPASHHGATFALNLPRSVSGQIASVGYENLNPQQAALLPPHFTLGRKSYQERFNQMMADSHQSLPAQDLEHYFEAQSSWDDTMAWKIAEAMATHPNQILFVIVGKFHVQYGGGLPDRLRARGVQKVLTLTQYNAAAGSMEDLQADIRPDPNYGAISDYIWIQGEPHP